MIRIGMDLDGVLAHFNEGFIDLIKTTTGIDLFPADYIPTVWEYPESLGYRKSDIAAVWRAIEASPDFWSGLAAYWPRRLMQPFMTYLNGIEDEDRLQVTFITSRPGRTAHVQSVRWLSEHGKANPQVIVAQSTDDKGVIAHLLQLHALIDDRPENLDALIRHVPRALPLLVEQPWNRPQASRYPSVAHDLGAMQEILAHWAGKARGDEAA